MKEERNTGKQTKMEAQEDKARNKGREERGKRRKMRGKE